MMHVVELQIPVAEDVWWDRLHGLTVVFRVLLPIVFFLAAMLFARFYPVYVRSQLSSQEHLHSVDTEGEGLGGGPQFKVLTNPLARPAVPVMGRPGPTYDI